MLFFWISVAILLVVSTLLVIPSLITKTSHGHSFSRKTFIFWSILFPCMSISLYFYYGDYINIQNWNQQVETHAQVQSTIEQYGSVDAIIEKFTAYVHEHPDESKGWYLLSKIYRSQNKIKEADQALQKAQALDLKFNKINRQN